MTKYTKYGVLFIGINPTSDANAIRSAMSLRKQMPGVSITFFTDQPNAHNPVFDQVVTIPSQISHPAFANAVQYPDQGCASKVWYMHQSPYQYTILLDYDVHITASLQPIFDVLEFGKFDLGVVMDDGYVSIERFYPDMPLCYPKFNGGMIAFSASERVDRFFAILRERLAELQSKGIGQGDEVALARALYECADIRYVTLPHEYNCRFIFPVTLRGRVAVLHGRSEIMDKVAKDINANDGELRVWADNRIIYRFGQ